MNWFTPKARKAERRQIEEQLAAAKRERQQATRDKDAALTRFQRVLRKAPAIELELLDFKHSLIRSNKND